MDNTDNVIKRVRMNIERGLVIIEFEKDGKAIKKGFYGKEVVKDWIMNAAILDIDLSFFNELPGDCLRMN